MFRKIVSNLSFSSALVGQLSFYAKRLRKEESTRRLGIFFMVLALLVQSVAIFNPPTSANAADSNDLVYGGIRPSDGGLSIFMRAYDSNTNGLRDIMNYFGITRGEITATKHGAWKGVASLSDSWYSVNHRQQGNPGEQEVKTTNSSTGGSMSFYLRPWYRTDNRNDTLWGFKGYSSSLASKTGSGTFYLMDICGNLIIKTPPVVKDIQVCNINTGNIITIKETDFNPAEHSRTVGDCNKIQVCDLSTNQLITITESAFNPNNHSRNLDDCKMIQVCDLTTFKIISIRQTEFDPNKQSLTISDCEDVQVCEIAIAKMVTISKADYENNKSRYSLDPADCNMIKVCDLSNYTVIAIVESAFDSTKQSKNIDDCQVCPLLGLGTISYNDPACTPCPLSGLEELAVTDNGCHDGEIATSKTASNISQGNIDATTTVAKAGDDIRYTITAKNNGGSDVVINFTDDVTDTLQYADLQETGGGSFDEESGTITWPDVTLKAGDEQSRTFAVRVKSNIPATPTGTSYEDSYDCVISNVYGTKTVIDVDCPLIKTVESVKELPRTGATENMIFAGILASIVFYFYLRSRQLGKEVRLIRRDLNTGVI